MGEEKVQIKILKATREALKERGKKGVTYDQIIRELLEYVPEFEARR